jgi:hypothetical protein
LWLESPKPQTSTTSQRFFRQTTHTQTNKEIGDSNRGGAAAAADLVLQNSQSKHAQVWNQSLVARKIASQETLSFLNSEQLAS